MNTDVVKHVLHESNLKIIFYIEDLIFQFEPENTYLFYEYHEIMFINKRFLNQGSI